MKISKDSIPTVYNLAKKVYQGEITVNEAMESIAKSDLMAEGSARIYISVFHYMMDGVAYTRAINEYSTDYFLRKIKADFGHDFFIGALKATAGHVSYYNSLGKGKRKSIYELVQNLHEEFAVNEELFNVFPDEIESEVYVEGAAKEVQVNAYERNVNARNECIAIKGLNCAVCNFNFEDFYGELGIGFIHVHHIVELSQIKEEYAVNPIKDLVPVCPNCHAMLHKRKPAYSIAELKERIANKKRT